ncbi:MAG: GCN5-related N-acetyltransferase [Nocardioides sp.]|nr:GCN5-related N-acetyltransferase [Nocardioides sp.]
MSTSSGAVPYVLEFTEDPRSFRDAAGAHLALDPVLTTVVSTVTDRAIVADARGVARPGHPRWWVTVRQGERVELTEPEMVERIEAGRVWLWEDDVGDAVHLTAFNPPSYGVARVGPVYTPRERRGRGFASAAVAEISRRLQEDASRVCLFTNQANPTSNKMYQAIGFRPVVDMANLVVTSA